LDMKKYNAWTCKYNLSQNSEQLWWCVGEQFIKN
jgi:hypothetical protein